MKSAFLGAAAVLAMAAPAVAGPVGTGLTHTEEVARRAAQRTVTIAHANPTCAQQAAKTIQARDGVASAKARPDSIKVVFHSNNHATQQTEQVRAVVTEACGAA